MAESSLTLVVETSLGTFIRDVRPATLLPDDVPRGGASEDATRYAAAYWGMPDFVFRSALAFRRSGSRELGDAIIVVGDYAASVQVKARDRATDDEARERAWLDKKIAEGIRQARGTIRNIVYSGRVTLQNERGRRISIAGAGKTWLRVVVVDHPGVDGYLTPTEGVVLLRRDWEFLFGQLKSTYAVLEYLARVHGISEQIALGTEPVRYYQLAAADAVAKPNPLDPRLVAVGAQPMSLPLLPQKPAEFGEVVRTILEDIAEIPTPDGVDPAMVNDMLAAIDTLPVAYRDELGGTVVDWLAEVIADKEWLRWRFRRMTGRPDKPHVILAIARRFNEDIEAGFQGYVSLRHQQMLEMIPENADIATVGVLITPRDDFSRPWDTTCLMTRGDQGLDPDYRELMEKLWGPYGESVKHDDFTPVLEAMEKMNQGAA